MKPSCRHASKTTTATEFERLRLRFPGTIGRRISRSPGQSARTAGGQPGCFAPEKKRISFAVAHLVEPLAARRFDGKHAPAFEPTETGRQVRVLMHACHVVIVESCAPDARIVQREPEWPDEVQRGAGVRAKPNNISGIGRDFGFEEDDVEQAL